MGAGRGPKKFGACRAQHPWIGVWLSLRNAPSHIFYHAELDHSRSDVLNIITEIYQKNMTHVSCLLRSLEVIRTDTERSVPYDFLLMIHCNFVPISSCTHSEINGHFCRSLHNFHHSVHLMLIQTTEGFPWNFFSSSWVSKTTVPRIWGMWHQVQRGQLLM